MSFRDITVAERELIEYIVMHSEIAERDVLFAQVEGLQIDDNSPINFKLVKVLGKHAPITARPSPLPGRTQVRNPSDPRLSGEIFFWLSNGYLDTIEYVCHFFEETPTLLPHVSELFQSGQK
ncbi:MAG: hypothetical protein ACRCSF_11795 [Mycobacteriaceae bacterium]